VEALSAGQAVAKIVAMEVWRAGHGMTAAAESLHAGCSHGKGPEHGMGGIGRGLGSDGSPEHGSQDATVKA